MNRCITEGRARFLKTYAAIEAGVECERFAPTLAALVAGTSSADALLALRPHIRHCATCRATVRDLHATRLGRLAALWPIPAVIAPLRWAGARLRNRDIVDGTRPADLAAASEGGPTSALTHGPLHRAGDAVAGIKQHAVGAYVRAADPTPLAGVRPGTAVAAVAGCLALGGGTTLCVTEGVDPIAGLSRVVAPAHRAKQHQPPKRRAASERVPVAVTLVPTPLATATPAPTPPPASSPTPQSTVEPTPVPIPEEEYEPVARAAAASSQPSAPARTPAPAPVGGAGEFDGP